MKSSFSTEDANVKILSLLLQSYNTRAPEGLDKESKLRPKVLLRY